MLMTKHPYLFSAKIVQKKCHGIANFINFLFWRQSLQYASWISENNNKALRNLRMRINSRICFFRQIYLSNFGQMTYCFIGTWPSCATHCPFSSLSPDSWILTPSDRHASCVEGHDTSPPPPPPPLSLSLKDALGRPSPDAIVPDTGLREQSQARRQRHLRHTQDRLPGCVCVCVCVRVRVWVLGGGEAFIQWSNIWKSSRLDNFIGSLLLGYKVC